MKKVLVADDDGAFRNMVGMTLESEEYELFYAKDGVEALKMARKEMPDVMVCDVVMPSLNGVEVTRMLKADDRTRGIHIILLTAASKKEDMEKGRQAGADDYFQKPFSPLNLLDRIHQVLDGKNRDKQAQL